MDHGKLNSGQPKSGPKHKNKAKFKHYNAFMKEKEKILNPPLSFLCEKCHQILKWRVDFEKYKPLTHLVKCTKCGEKTINKAYRIICDKCAIPERFCTSCGIKSVYVKVEPKADDPKRKAEMKEDLSALTERQKRTILRKLESKELCWEKGKGFVYSETKEKYFEDKKKEGAKDSDKDSDSDSPSEDENCKKIL